MTNNFILSLAFSLIIFFGVCRDGSENSLQVATIVVEKNLLHLTGKTQNTETKQWSLFTSLKGLKLHIVYQVKKNKHECLSCSCIHLTANGFSIGYCCVKRLLSIIYTILFLLFLHKFSDISPVAYKNDRMFKGCGKFASAESIG
jgi:hypothetical protein